MMRILKSHLSLLCAVTLGIGLAACGGSSTGSESGSAAPTSNIPEAILETYTAEQVLKKTQEKYLRFAESYNPTGGYPRTIKAGTHQWGQIQLTWTSGFFPASLWQLAYYSQEQALYQQAQRWTSPLASATDWNGHDLGFLIDYSFGKAGRITGSNEYDAVRRQAADNLLARYDTNVGAIRSWDSDNGFVVIIDNMMNLSLLFDAARYFNDDRYFQAAYDHALTSARELVREDGSSFHLVNFNQNNGQVNSKGTHQGLADDSTWARGQAWGIYGFALAAKETGSAVLLDTASKLADYYIAHLPSDGVPFWDFDATGTNVPKDSSAAVIAAAGMWLLSEQLSESEGSEYRQASVTQVDKLLNNNYLAMGDEDYLLKHATGNKPGDYEVDTALIYADYYLIEVLLLHQGIIGQPL